jgi:hypothetical protein
VIELQYRRMKDGEIFDTDTGGDLVVNNSVNDCRSNARENDFESFFHQRERCRSSPRPRLAILSFSWILSHCSE